MIPVSKANEIFDTTFTVYKSTSSDVETIQALKCSVPTDLTDIIEVVQSTTSFPNPKPKSPSVSVINGVTANNVRSGDIATIDVSQNCNDVVTPACLQSLYCIPTTPATQAGNAIAVPGFLLHYAQQSDLSVSELALLYLHVLIVHFRPS